LIGKRYKEEKKAVGENQYTSKTTEDIKRVDHSEPPKTTAQKIAEQSKVSPKTVEILVINLPPLPRLSYTY
jgi:hypothetical protein